MRTNHRLLDKNLCNIRCTAAVQRCKECASGCKSVCVCVCVVGERVCGFFPWFCLTSPCKVAMPLWARGALVGMISPDF
jgi:hypothetical protein